MVSRPRISLRSERPRETLPEPRAEPVPKNLSRPFRPRWLVAFRPRASACGLSPGLGSPGPLGRNTPAAPFHTGSASPSGLVGADIVPEPGLELDLVGEAAAEAGDPDPLSQADERDLERIDPGGAVNEDGDRAGTVVDRE